MKNEELVAELIRRILPDLHLQNIAVQSQKAVEIGPDIHGVRFDVHVTLEDGKNVIIEMQVRNTKDLPKSLIPPTNTQCEWLRT